jgi:predicted phage terminase large subunit-like protein
MNNNLTEVELFFLALRVDFKSFVIKVFKEVATGSKYNDNFHINVICHELLQVFNGQQNKLIINIPPRYMKSIICSIAFVAWLLGKNPKLEIICVSYSDDLATDLALKCRNVMESDWYKYTFPATVIAKSKKAVNDFKTTAGGGRFSVSMGGAITGRGGDYIIIDDPIKPEDANSDVIRERVNGSYGSTLISRLNDKTKGKIVVIMQRTHEMDFTGYLLETDPSFKLVKMPGIAEEDERWPVTNCFGKEIILERKVGEALHPDRENLEKLQQMKSVMGSYAFAGQYQQNPTSRGGNVIKRDWLQFHNIEQLKKDIWNGKLRACEISQSWDTASKIEQHNDYSVCITYLSAYNIETKKRYIYILDVFRDKLEMPALIKKAIELRESANKKYISLVRFFNKIVVEDVGTGIGFGQALQEQYGQDGVELIKPERDKATRIKNTVHFLENGTCLFPDNKPAWWPIFERELITFPGATHDDQCDALSQLLTYEFTKMTAVSGYGWNLC